MMDARQKTAQSLKAAFRQYYFTKFDVDHLPDRLPQREFGYSRLGEQGMIRHIAMKSSGELKALLVKEAPADVYCSNALYREPSAPMQGKGWLGASLIFDIDGKDLNLPCVPEHTYSLCQSCDCASQNSNSPSVCTLCQSSKVSTVSIPCKKCINASKTEVARLVQYLREDIGVEKKDLAVYFSGNNGFHVHVSTASFEPLDSLARADLAGYLLGKGIVPESFGLLKGSAGKQTIRFRKSGLSFGWRRRISEKLDLTSAQRLEHIVAKLGGYSAFRDTIHEVAEALSVKIDPQVTSDVHRIFRLPDTLNSKSSLAKVYCSDISDFDPFKEACVLGDEMVAIRMKCAVHLRLKGKAFRISKEKLELPAFAASYLLCKGLAEAE